VPEKAVTFSETLNNKEDRKMLWIPPQYIEKHLIEQLEGNKRNYLKCLRGNSMN
jgi:hypothetical protein